MGKKGVLVVFWAVGYALGMVAWYLRDPALTYVESLGLNAEVGQALLAGLFGSVVMVMTVLFWSFLSSS